MLIEQDLLNIPAALKLLPQWVCHKAKIPYDPKNGRRAKANDPKTWGSYDQAVIIARSGKYDGLGFEFSENDPFSGIDLDHCIVEGVILPWAKTIIDQLNSYSEQSPSRTGIHIIIKAQKPQGRCRKGHLEIYGAGRYFTVTGKRVPDTLATIENRQTEIEKLHAEIFRPSPPKNVSKPAKNLSLSDAQLIEKAVSARNGSKFKALWQGDISGYGSHSEADQALCLMLAFWADKNSGRIDSIFRQSGLMRDKWDRQTGDQTYGGMTVARAIEGTKETYKSSKDKKFPNLNKQALTIAEPVTRTLKELDELELPEIKWIVKGLIPEGLMLLAGKPKCKKSWFALSTGLAVATGGYALGSISVEKGAVLYLALEDTERRLKDRARQVMCGQPLPDNFHYCCRDWGRLPLAGEWIDKFIEKHKDTRLVMIDTLQKIRAPSQKGKTAYEQDYESISTLKSIADKYTIGMIILHHVRKATAEDIYDTLSGTMGLSGSADTIAVLHPEPRSKMDGTLFVKGRDVDEMEKALRFDSDTGTWAIVGDADEFRKSNERQAIIKCLKDSTISLSPREVSELLGTKSVNVKKLMGQMLKSGEIASEGRAKYIYKNQSLIEGEI